MGENDTAEIRLSEPTDRELEVLSVVATHRLRWGAPPSLSTLCESTKYASTCSVRNIFRKLLRRGLLAHGKRGTVKLTDAGEYILADLPARLIRLHYEEAGGRTRGSGVPLSKLRITEAKLPRTLRPLSSELAATLADEWERGASVRMLSDRYGISRRQVLNHLRFSTNN